MAYSLCHMTSARLWRRDRSRAVRERAFPRIHEGEFVEHEYLSSSLAGARRRARLSPRPYCLRRKLGRRPSVGRGARDPLRADVIVGSEGKGMFAGAGIPADNMPIFAARDGAVPAGVQPLPHDIFTTQGLLQGPRALVRPALLPLQLAGGPRADLGRVRGTADRRRSAAHGRVGFLRPRLSARGDREPLRVQDGEGALRRAARRKRARSGGPTVHTQATLPDWNGRYGRERAKTATWYYGAMLQIPDLPVAADAGIPEALRAADVSLLRQQRAAVAGLVLLARGLHAALRAVRRRRASTSS